MTLPSQTSTITTSDGYSSSGSQGWDDEDGGQLFFVTSYSDFDKLGKLKFYCVFAKA